MIGVSVVIAALGVWLIPRSQRKRWEGLGVGGKDLAELENAARSTLVQLVGGVALILTFVATWVQISDTRKASERTTELTEAQQETDHFTRAVEQLGSRRLEVRMGGIYALQQFATRRRESRDEEQRRRETVAMLMISFLKSNPRPPVHTPPDERYQELNRALKRKEPPYDFCRATGAIPPRPDTQAALTVLFGLVDDDRSDRPPALMQLDLAYDDLVGVRLEGKDLTNANLRLASLAGAKLSNVKLNDAQLSGADLRGACLQGARFENVTAKAIKAARADFSGARLATALYLRCKYFKNAVTTGATPPQKSPEEFRHCRFFRQ